MTTPTLRSQAAPSRLIALRILAFLAGMLVLIGAAIISIGTALLAPIGMWALSVYRRQRRRSTTRAAMWVAAMTWVAVGMFGLTLVIVGSLPDGSVRQMQQAADSASAASYQEPPPAWMERMAPGTTARAAHGSQTPASLRTPMLIWGVGVGLLFLAGLAGSLGWAGWMLCGFAIAGRWPHSAAHDEPEGLLTNDLGITLAS